MEPLDPDTPDPTEQNRRQFMQRTGAVSIAAAIGLAGESTTATASIDENGEFETDPFSLGVASGDPLPGSVILWTRLAPEPLTASGGMPDQPVDVQWAVATDESMSDVVTSGTATAEPAHAHSVHVDAGGLEPNTEYYYQFTAGGVRSPVGRTKTAPAPGTTVEEFRFAFASCQWWEQGYYTAYSHMAADELDLIVHLGDYIYEYGVPADGGARGVSTPQAYRKETETLDQYRLRYSLYKADSDLRAAHASAPWLVTRDDHEVDNNWAGDVPQDPGEQPTEAFLKRRAAAFKAYYEHMPFRMEQKPEGPDQKLYRYYEFGDLVDFNTLDTRLYRSDQACDDGFGVVECQERFAEDRTILGDAQESWLVDNLKNSGATWNVVANQLPFAKMDFLRGSEKGYRMDQWDGYVADQKAVKNAFEKHAENPVVVTGDFHSNWANEIRSVSDESKPIGAEFVGTSISSGGDGGNYDDFNGDDEGVLGIHVIEENDNVLYNSDRRGYVRCTLTPETWETEFLELDYVTEPGSPIRTDARFTLAAGAPGLQQPPTTLEVDSIAVGNGEAGTAELFARWLPDGLAGVDVELTITNPEVATFIEVSVPDALGLAETSVEEGGAVVTLRAVDVEDDLTAVPGGTDVPLASLEIGGEGAGTTDVEITVDRVDDDAGGEVETRTYSGVVVTGPPPVGGGDTPIDLDDDGRYEDVNGNGRLDYDDINALFESFESDTVRLNKNAYDFNENGRLDYDDVVSLYERVN